MTEDMDKLYQRLEKLISLHKTENIGPGTINRLIEGFGSFDDIRLYDTDNVKKYLRSGFVDSFAGFHKAGKEEIEDQIKRMEKSGACLVVFGDTKYPDPLKRISIPPPFLFMRGDWTSRDEIAIAVVGTRKPSNYGRNVTEKLSSDLARNGIVVVSGFASGIDTIAHKNAIEAGGRTIAVLGCGVDVIYPSINRKLWESLPENGLMVSQYLMGTAPLGAHFPNRNRIISAMSLGVMIIEAPGKSGSLITAQYALEQDKEVFAVPADIHSENSKGSNLLIQKGAKLVMSVDDILTEIGVIKADGIDLPSINLSELSDIQVKIYETLSVRPIPIDTLSRRLAILPHNLLSDLSIMELKGFVKQLPGKQFVRAI